MHITATPTLISPQQLRNHLHSVPGLVLIVALYFWKVLSLLMLLSCVTSPQRMNCILIFACCGNKLKVKSCRLKRQTRLNDLCHLRTDQMLVVPKLEVNICKMHVRILPASKKTGLQAALVCNHASIFSTGDVRSFGHAHKQPSDL